MIKSIAVLQNLGGKKIIDETPEFDNYFSDYGGEKLSNERSKLIARLLADGWEPLSTDQWGNVNSFRREVP